MDFFMEQSYKIQIFILSYLRFDDKVASMNGTSYSLDNITITHLVPSPREDGGGIVVRRDLQDRVSELVKLGLPEARKKFFSEIGREIPPELLDSPWISVFCYPEGRKVIENFITA